MQNITPDRQNVPSAKNLNTIAGVFAVNPDVDGIVNEEKCTIINGIHVTENVITAKIWIRNKFFWDATKLSLLHFIPSTIAENKIYGQIIKIIIPYVNSWRDPLAVPQDSNVVIPISFKISARIDAEIPNIIE